MRSHFHLLHHQTVPLILAPIWDPASAVLAQQQGAKALGTSSAALAWSLGYADGQQLPVAELIAVVQRIRRVSKVPFTVDIELGYSNEPSQVAELVCQQTELAVAGINMEDGTAEPQLLCAKIRACRALLKERALFINARTDVYLAQLATGPEAAVECIRRLELYKEAGADGAFVPGLTDLAIAKQLSQHSILPLNLMGWPEGGCNYGGFNCSRSEACKCRADVISAKLSGLSAGCIEFFATKPACRPPFNLHGSK